VTADPFSALGLPIRPDLTDDEIRAAWRRIAESTHPDLPGGGDPGRYAAASAAWTELRTPGGRGEAYADLRSGRATAVPGPGLGRATAVPGPGDGRATAGAGQHRAPAPPAVTVAARVRRGRPLLLALRVVIAAGVCVAAFGVVGPQPAAWGLAVGALTWLLLTARHDLAPPS
jgi:hypothetical protein